MEDPYYSQFPQTRSGSITPVIIDDEARFRMEHMERQLASKNPNSLFDLFSH